MKKPVVKLPHLAAIISLLIVVMFHRPFFSYVSQNIEADLNGVMIFAGLAIVLFGLNFIVFSLLLLAGKIGRGIISFFFIGNAISLYFINTYDVIIDDTMMGNVFNTNAAEATSYYSPIFILYVLLMGVLPSVLLFMVKVDRGRIGRLFAKLGAMLVLLLAAALGNMSNFTWIDRHAPVIGSLLLPWSYVVNTFRYYGQQRRDNAKEILLPDASVRGEGKDVVVLVIGESARRDHFQLYGYGRPTNPVLSAMDDLTCYKANSSATYTTAGVKAILDHKEDSKLYEILPNYLYRAGVDVLWNASNWGQSPLHIEHYHNAPEQARTYGYPNEDWDEVLLGGVSEFISGSPADKVLVVLHTSTSHGPSYNKRYPPQFEVFTPICETVEMSKCPQDQLINSYDNTIVYTDWLLGEVISMLKGIEGRRCAMIYVSDHGESLGENGLYMHGVPIAMAPAEQYEIPFIVWTSDHTPTKPLDLATQYHVFHSVMDFLQMQSPVYNEDMSIFE